MVQDMKKATTQLVAELAEVRTRVAKLKDAEQALAESEERYRSLVESGSDWVWEVDVRGVYIYVSQKVEDLLGYQPEEVLGKTPFDFMPAEEAKRVARVYDKILEQQILWMLWD